jgi:hypothetical protein
MLHIYTRRVVIALSVVLMALAAGFAWIRNLG